MNGGVQITRGDAQDKDGGTGVGRVAIFVCLWATRQARGGGEVGDRVRRLERELGEGCPVALRDGRSDGRGLAGQGGILLQTGDTEKTRG